MKNKKAEAGFVIFLLIIGLIVGIVYLYMNQNHNAIQCKNYYWFDESKSSCNYKQFCDAFMYYGLRIFNTLEDCNSQLNITDNCISGDIKKYKCSDETEVPWCVCSNNSWACILSPENRCPVCGGLTGFKCSSGYQCINNGQPFTSGRCYPLDKPLNNAEICNSAGGRWNNCGSICQIMNQGKEGVACPMVCGELCECGTILGLRCPEGYFCFTPSGISDAMGYCGAVK